MNSLLTIVSLAVIGLTFAESCSDVNAEYKDCGTACPVTCANMNEPRKNCIDVCVKGCFCKDGFVSDVKDGKCVMKKDCQHTLDGSKCHDPNETFKTCGTACPKTCRNYQNPPSACILVCRQGCFCNSPYVRDESTGKCVETSKCEAHSSTTSAKNIIEKFH